MSARHLLTVDLEDWHQGFLARPWPDWPDAESRLVACTERILQCLAEAEARATFFCVGATAREHPSLIRTIVDAGHEIACHGLRHTPVTGMDPQAFRSDCTEAKALLEDLSGTTVVGYRAPCFSIGKQTPWADEILLAAGFRYDSSRLPSPWSRFRDPCPRAPHFRAAGDGLLIEVPATTWRSLPTGGGLYWRLFPKWVIHRSVRACEQDARPFVAYLHPWEFGPRPTSAELKAWNIPAGERFAHRHRLHRTEKVLRDLLRSHRFGRVDHWLKPALHEIRPESVTHLERLV
jgi:polysaccharide deacetylase family protein (PEP-CTERM system associated)